MDVPLFLLLIAVVTLSRGDKTRPFVQTTTGAIRGSRITVLGKEICELRGIPYATPPTGDLRFKKPKPVKPWKEVYEATDKPNRCMQYSPLEQVSNNTITSEDCLYLNLWVPHQDEGINKQLKPIMVWIYGGGFVFGESGADYYNGSVLAAYGDVIVGSMNYRLGAFGFLNAEIKEAPGNMGMLDQVLALKWIKDNAKAFGGDPDRITIFGESSGSTSVGLHLVSPLSQGLFTRAIMQSGTPFHTEWGGQRSSGLERGDRLARGVGCSNDTTSLYTHPHEVVDCLKGIDALNLSQAEVSVFGSSLRLLPIFGDEFLPQNNFITALHEKNVNITNVLTGITLNEGASFLAHRSPDFFSDTDPTPWTMENVRNSIKKFCEDLNISKCEDVLEFYLNGVNEGDERSLAQVAFDVQGDNLVTCPEVLFSDAMSKITSSTVYFYIMDYYPSVSNYEPWIGMTHFDDVQFVFGLPFMYPDVYSELDTEMSRSVMDKWTKFAKTGNPNDQNEPQWPTFKPKDRRYLEIKVNEDTVRPIDDNLDRRCQFWKKLFI